MASRSTKLTARIGLFGGSFNPVHNGHMKLAKFALSELNLDKVVFVPAYRNADKVSKRLLPAPLRVACSTHETKRAEARGRRRKRVAACRYRPLGTKMRAGAFARHRRSS